MSENSVPDPLEDYDDAFDDDRCWQCHGTGIVYDCFEEYACIDPEEGCDQCERRCDVCRPHTPQVAT